MSDEFKVVWSAKGGRGASRSTGFIIHHSVMVEYLVDATVGAGYCHAFLLSSVTWALDMVLRAGSSRRVLIVGSLAAS